MCKFRKWLIRKLGGQIGYKYVDHYIKSCPAQCITLRVEEDQKEYIVYDLAEKMARSLIENNLLTINQQSKEFEHGFSIYRYAAELVVVKDSDPVLHMPKGEPND